MQNNISKVKTCTGCFACLERCPQKAIYFHITPEGFYKPQVDTEKCINCGLCIKQCPTEHPQFANDDTPECFAAAFPERATSSSGGIFPMLAQKILAQGGYVCGAAWDEFFNVKHIIISQASELTKLQKSKYIQSNIKGIYPQIEKLLQANKKVLFSGTPCQVAGLKSFLKKEYQNLLTIDIVCHGVPSPKVLQKYIQERALNTDEKILSIDFRNKEAGWFPSLSSVKIVTNKRVFYNPDKEDSFMVAFLKDLSLKPSCSNCPFAKFPRQGDITLGDFWGIKHYKSKLDDKKGTSLLLLNNSKGKEFIKSLKQDFIFCEKVPLKHAVYGNPSLVKATSMHKNREQFFANLDKMSLEENLDICLARKYDCGILNFWHTNNYGALLTCYGLQEYLKKSGFNAKVINYIPLRWLSRFKGNISEEFSQKHLDLTTLCHSYEDLQKLNQQTQTFIAGSDQIWRYRYIRSNGKEIYALNFADNQAKKIAYAASFGTNEFEGTTEEYLTFKYYLQRFNFVSVREDSGVTLSQNIFHKDATHVLDPVFLLSQKEWETLVNQAQTTEKFPLVSYILNANDLSKEVQKRAEEHFRCTNFNISDASEQIEKPDSVEDFLYKIKHCRFFITDSFHGLCFALIFNKPFICLSNCERGNARFQSILKQFHLQSRVLSTLQDLSRLKQLFSPMNYKNINQEIAIKKTQSEQWLLQALTSKSEPLPSPQEEMIDTLFQIIKTYQDTTNRQNILFRDIFNYNKIKRKYYRYNLLSKITFGKKRKHYKEKKQQMKARIKAIKMFLKKHSTLN